MTPRCWIWCLICKRKVLALLVPPQCPWACSQGKVTQSGTLLPTSSRLLFSLHLISFCSKHWRIMVKEKLDDLTTLLSQIKYIILSIEETKALWWEHQKPCKRILCNIKLVSADRPLTNKGKYSSFQRWSLCMWWHSRHVLTGFCFKPCKLGLLQSWSYCHNRL